MPVTIKCQHSGIEFEAATRRTKQHPMIADLKKAASKDGRYRQMDAALDAVAKDGDYTTIEEYVAQVEQHMAGVPTVKQLAYEKRVERERALDEIKARRAAENTKLASNGYTWSKEAVGTEGPGTYGAGIGEFSHYEWFLYSPDGREVSVTQAMAEIDAGGYEVYLQAQVEKAEIEAHTENEKRDAQAATEAEYEHLLDEVRTLPRVEGIPAWRNQFTKIIKYQFGHAYRAIWRGEINGVTCYVHDTSFSDDASFHCADPEAAGLTALNLSKREQEFDDIFGI